MLTAEDVRRLERLALTASPTAHAGGSRQAGTRGSGLEFQDYRSYEPGDDPRWIDWTVEARLRHLVVRVTEAEGHLPLRVLLDASGSMAIGSPPKLAAAARLAAAFCYVAAARRDPLGVALLGDGVREHLPAAAGRAQLFRAIEILRHARAGGSSALGRCLERYGGALGGPGLTVVLSDYLDGSDLVGLRYLLYRRQLPVVVQVLAPEDVEPGLAAITELTDAEHPGAVPLVVEPAAEPAYRRQIAQVTLTLSRFCQSNAIPFVQILSSQPFDHMIAACVRAGVLEQHA